MPAAPHEKRRALLPASAGAHDLAAQIFGRDPQRRLVLLRAAWSLAVGAELARRTEVIGLEGRMLRVRVPDERWRKALHRMRRDILSRLRQTAGSLAPAALGLQEGPIRSSVPAPATAAPKQAPDAPEAVSPVITEAAAVIPDPDLRELFTQVATRYLNRQRHA